MENLFTADEYSDKAIEANSKGEILYIYVHDMEYQEQVLEWTYKEEEVPVYDEEGNPTGETQIIQVPDQPIMETVTEIDPITGEEVTYEIQKFHYETRVKEVAELLVAPANYYICYEENYTKGEVNPNYEADKETAEKERIAKLHLTKREVFLGLHKAKQVTPDMIKAQITDAEALIEFEYATEYFRGNPLIDMVGEKLNITPKQLDMFFETNNYLYLTDCTLTINPTPLEAKVIMNDVETKTMTVPFGNVIKYSVSQEGYKVNKGSFEAVVDLNLDIVLEKEEVLDDSTTDKQPDTIPDETTVTTDQGE